MKQIRAPGHKRESPLPLRYNWSALRLSQTGINDLEGYWEIDMTSIERAIETIIFNSRWIAVPFLFGLILGLVGLLYKFVVKLGVFLWRLREIPNTETLVGVLSLVDLSLIANLILIVVCSSYENFVRPINPAVHPEMPVGLSRIGFSLLKQKLLGSIVAITAVHLLERFMDIEHQVDAVPLAWLVGAMIAFAVVMVIVASADHLSEFSANKDR
jgi:uncharacterized protein (TIGR00645 family)